MEVKGQIDTVVDKLTPQKYRTIARVFSDHWEIHAQYPVTIQGVPIYFFHYRDVVYNLTGHFPKDNTKYAISEIVRARTSKGCGLFAHVADYNYAPCLVLHGYDGQLNYIRLDSSTYPLLKSKVS